MKTIQVNAYEYNELNDQAKLKVKYWLDEHPICYEEDEQQFISNWEEDIILVSGNMYSHLGVFSHIDFFNMPWVVTAIFQERVKARAIMPLNTYTYLDGDRIVDPKSLVSISVTKDFYLYDSSENKLTVISRAELPNVLASRSVEIRHWAQWAKGTYIEIGITYLSPRLAYLFH